MGMVCVRPGKLPAKVIVAPNSPSARAQHRTALATSDGATIGTVTRRNTVIRVAPSVAAASSNPWSAERRAPSTVTTRNGTATTAGATSGPGADRGPPPAATRRLRSRVLSRDLGVAVSTDGGMAGTSQGRSKPAAASTAWAAGDSTYATNAAAVAGLP